MERIGDIRDGFVLRKTVLFQNFARKAKIFLGGGTGRFFQNLLLRHAFLHKIGFHGPGFGNVLAGPLSASHNNNGIRVFQMIIICGIQTACQKVGHAFASQAGAQYDHRFFLFGRGVGVAAHRDEYKQQRKNGAAAEKDDF